MPTLQSTITCPYCGVARVETMPADACVHFYECTGCGKLLRPKPGDCCVFCSYGTERCPPKQLEATAQRPTAHESRALPYLALFSSVGTLLCCALPTLLVFLGFGATVVSAAPWLVTLSRHKAWFFTGTTLLLAANFYYVYRLAPRMLIAGGACPADDPAACAQATRVSRVVLWLSVAIYAVGFSVAYVLPWALLRLES